MPVLKPLSGSSEAPQQYKQPSRKGKKAWRKNVDVTEVQKGLEERNEEIIKGGLVAEKPSADLFTLDVVGDVAITKKHNKHASRKGLKADEIIAARSAVPAVSLRKRPGDTPANVNGKVSDGILPAKRQRTTYVSHKELVRLRKVADGQHESTVAIVDATYDPWAEDAPAPNQKAVAAAAADAADDDAETFDFLPKPQKKKAPKTLREQPISLTASGKPVPAVPKPTGGYSYNPSFEEYEQRFVAEGNKAIEAERKRLEDLEAERLRHEASARSAAEAEAAEARADLSEWDEDSAWEGFESGAEDASGAVTRSKRPERKTQAQRNRIQRRKEEERRLRHEAALKRKNEQATRIAAIAREVTERDETRALARIEMASSDEEEADDAVELRRRQLGKFRLPDKDLELVLPDELQDSLRLLKPEGNLLKDRYRNMLVRGRMESRRHIPFKKQARTKLTEKWTHKDFRL